ncbi:MAG: hypothetical protein JXR76_12665 [Deltaproteobacteria bacterium]|nr:hypothetical protein [Deltaproteobacteria bacterium]
MSVTGAPGRKDWFIEKHPLQMGLLSQGLEAYRLFGEINVSASSGTSLVLPGKIALGGRLPAALSTMAGNKARAHHFGSGHRPGIKLGIFIL